MPQDHATRMQRAMLSLDGLSIGDAFGQCFFSIALDEFAYEQRLANRLRPDHRWPYTDDTDTAAGRPGFRAEVPTAHRKAGAGATATEGGVAFGVNNPGEKSPKLTRFFMNFVLNKPPASRPPPKTAQAIDLPRFYDIATA